MGWSKDIAIWARKNNKDPETVAQIAIRKGWEPAKYLPSMAEQLFDYLDQWYTLSVKALPIPATQKRRNPVASSLRSVTVTELENGWTIWNMPVGKKYSIIASDGNRYLEFSDNKYRKARQIEAQLLERLQ